jgi:hypothetical protein
MRRSNEGAAGILYSDGAVTGIEFGGAYIKQPIMLVIVAPSIYAFG